MSELIFTFPDHQSKQLTATQLPSTIPWISYSLFINIEKNQTITVGRFGSFLFIPGSYIYSGSARRNLLARVNRHLRQEKKLRWHIDYLLNAPTVDIIKVLVSTISECELVAAGGGTVLVPGFGASDCRSGCGSHLRIL
ncbi:MAG: GIY-YIG nuclease family protein [Pseudomonadota bacterium]|nr:GIY-YIG nuclease family protein [Pseudomonadota bacterium]